MHHSNDDEIIQQMLVDLASDAPGVYEAAEAWFLQQGLAMVPALLSGLENELLGSVCHWRILLILREFAEEKTLLAILKAFERALRDGDPIVLPGAMEALAVFHAREAVDALIGLLSEDDADIVRHAAGLLGDMGDEIAVKPLLELLENEDPSIRYSASRALIRFDSTSVRKALEEHLEGEVDLEIRGLLTSAGIGSSHLGSDE